VRRARARAAEADLVLWLVDTPSEKHPDENAAPVWRVRTRSISMGWGGVPWLRPVGRDRTGPYLRFRRVAATDSGIDGRPDSLCAGLFRFRIPWLIGRARQRQLLQETVAFASVQQEVLGEGEELAAENLRVAAHSSGGCSPVDVEDILDVIFREFV